MQVCQTTIGQRQWPYLKNKTSTSELQENITQRQKWSERKRDVSHLRVFGSIAYARIPNCDIQFGIYENEEATYRWLLQEFRKVTGCLMKIPERY